MKGFAIQIEPNTQIAGVYSPVVKVLRGDDGKITQGLFVGSTQAQNEALILMCNPGEMKNAPTLGVGLGTAVLSPINNTTYYAHQIRRNYALEGLHIDLLNCYDLRNITIKARY